jgi:hypothetical protein
VTIKVPNEDVLKAGIAHAERDLNTWNQCSWIDWDDECGTTACLAGHIVLAQHGNLREVSVGGGTNHVAQEALRLLGFDVTVQGDRSWDWDRFISPDTASFYSRIFLHTRDIRLGQDAYGEGYPLATHPDAFKYFKEHITEVTGVEL